MTKKQILEALAVLPDDSVVAGVFNFATYTSNYDARIENINITYGRDGSLVAVMTLKEVAEEKEAKAA